MDISCPHSNLSLNFSSHALSSQRTQIANDSISLQLDSSFRDPTHPIPSVPLHLLEPLAGNHKTWNGNSAVESDEDEDREVEEFCILGHPICLKRRRDGESSSSSSSSSKWVSLDPNLKVRRAAVRSWGNQTLRDADPDIYGIMEKEKKRQYKGIELIASENCLSSCDGSTKKPFDK